MSLVRALSLRSAFLALAASAALREGNAAAPAGPPAAPRGQQNVLQIRARELWTAAGERIQDGLLVVEDGRIRSAGAAKDADPGLPLLHHDGVVTAGLIACRSQTGAAGRLQDDTRSVLSEARAVHAVDLAGRDLERALAAGITSLGISPGNGNLVGGLACVVKTSGGRVLDGEASLALSLTAAALGRSTVQLGFPFGAAEDDGAPVDSAAFDLPSPSDGGPETTARTTRGTREPTSYAGALARLRELFERGQGPFGRAKRGELPVTIEAWDRHEVVRAARLAQELGLVGSIRGAPLAGDPDVLAALRSSGLGVVVGPYSADQTRRSLESVKLLAEAGVPVAFALDAPLHHPSELRLSAARALRGGAARDAVWKALTEDAARLSGVEDATGKLAPGLEADFVLWSGDPLDLSSRVVSVYVDGKRAWPASRDH